MVETAVKEKEKNVTYRSPYIETGKHYLEGSEACVEGALIAGLKVYAGYPITPALGNHGTRPPEDSHSSEDASSRWKTK